jgi:two-component system chemotaxis response regulator CheY
MILEASLQSTREPALTPARQAEPWLQVPVMMRGGPGGEFLTDIDLPGGRPPEDLAAPGADVLSVGTPFDLAAYTAARPVLISDDSLEMAAIIKLILERVAGLTVIAVTDPHTTLELFRNQPLSLVISDVMKPDIDGFTMLKALRALPGGERMPFLFASARTDRSCAMQAQVLGAAGYLVKPLLPEPLARVVVRILQQRAATLPAIAGQPPRFDPEFVKMGWRLLSDDEPVSAANAWIACRCDLYQRVGSGQWSDYYIGPERFRL